MWACGLYSHWHDFILFGCGLVDLVTVYSLFDACGSYFSFVFVYSLDYLLSKLQGQNYTFIEMKLIILSVIQHSPILYFKFYLSSLKNTYKR